MLKDCYNIVTMIDFEQSLRQMSEKGQAALCVPAAFKDAGVNVPQKFFIEAALRSTMNPEELARELGLSKIERGQDIEKVLESFERLREQGIFIFIRIGGLTDIGVIGQHLNSITQVEGTRGDKTLVLGGISPFGKQRGNVFKLDTLKRFIPKKDGILFFKKEK